MIRDGAGSVSDLHRSIDPTGGCLPARTDHPRGARSRRRDPRDRGGCRRHACRLPQARRHGRRRLPRRRRAVLRASSRPPRRAISTKSRSKKNDVKILNYALTLEYLEAEFYKQANAVRRAHGRAGQAVRRASPASTRPRTCETLKKVARLGRGQEAELRLRRHRHGRGRSSRRPLRCSRTRVSRRTPARARTSSSVPSSRPRCRSTRSRRATPPGSASSTRTAGSSAATEERSRAAGVRHRPEREERPEGRHRDGLHPVASGARWARRRTMSCGAARRRAPRSPRP